MATRAGQVLTDTEAAEYQAYGNAGLAQPEKFAGVVVDNTRATGIVYRYASAEETKAADEAARSAEAATAEGAKLTERVRAEAAKRGVAAADAASAPPPMPGA